MITGQLAQYFANRKLADRSFGTGAIPDKKPINLGKTVRVGAGAFDWKVGFRLEEYLSTMFGRQLVLPISNQGSSLSCVGQSTAKGSSVLNLIETGLWIDASARDIYSAIRLNLGGAYLMDGVDRVVTKGVLLDDQVPSKYPDGSCDEILMMKKPREDDVLAQFRKVLQGKDPVYVANDIDSIAKAISLYKFVILGFSGANNGSWHTPFPKKSTQNEWGHAVLADEAFIHSERGQVIGYANSWGTDIGENGRQFLTKDWFDGHTVFGAIAFSDEKNRLFLDEEYQKLTEAISIMDANHSYPAQGYSIYHEQNWAAICAKAGISVKWGSYYDHMQAKKLRAKYGI